MTTAHRPTWNAAIASNSNPGGNMMVAQTTKINNRDAATFKKMKFRQDGRVVAGHAHGKVVTSWVYERIMKTKKTSA
eukprot:Skav212484  [mRNA]  locus=scaffold385:571842:572543:+ [translate_table: standard]